MLSMSSAAREPVVPSLRVRHIRRGLSASVQRCRQPSDRRYESGSLHGFPDSTSDTVAPVATQPGKSRYVGRIIAVGLFDHQLHSASLWTFQLGLLEHAVQCAGRHVVRWFTRDRNTPGLVGCLYCRCEPRVATRNQPSCSIRRTTSRTFMPRKSVIYLYVKNSRARPASRPPLVIFAPNFPPSQASHWRRRYASVRSRQVSPSTAAAARSGLRCPSACRPSSAPGRRTGRRGR